MTAESALQRAMHLHAPQLQPTERSPCLCVPSSRVKLHAFLMAGNSPAAAHSRSSLKFT